MPCQESITDGQRIPADWHQAITSQLEPDEAVVAWFLPDLNSRGLRCAESVLVLTDRRLISFTPHADAHRSVSLPGELRHWKLAEVAGLRARDRSGLGRAELEGPGGELVHWHYTGGRTSPRIGWHSATKDSRGAPTRTTIHGTMRISSMNPR